MNNNPTITPQVVPSPFHNFCMSIGAIPTSYKDSLDYYETLLWLIKFLDEIVIPAVTTNGNAVAELQTFYLQLQTYVNDYFTNLDVQEEINNKLDSMATDGTLTNLIKAYVDPIYQEYENSINDTVGIQNNRITSIENELTSVASGSPLVASNVSDMTDTTRVYVNTSNGKWYYYDGDSWEIGGTYQSTGIGEKEIKRFQLDDDLRNSIFKNYESTNLCVYESLGNFNPTTQGIVENEAYRSITIPITGGHTYVVRGSNITSSITFGTTENYPTNNETVLDRVITSYLDIFNGERYGYITADADAKYLTILVWTTSSPYDYLTMLNSMKCYDTADYKVSESYGEYNSQENSNTLLKIQQAIYNTLGSEDIFNPYDKTQWSNILPGASPATTYAVLNGYISVIFPLENGESYTIVKNSASGRFRLSFANSYPFPSYTEFNDVSNHDSDTSVSFTNSDNYKYIVIQLRTTSDSAQLSDIVKGLHIYKTSTIVNPSYKFDNLLDDKYINLVKERQLGVLSKGYIALSCDDGDPALATYTIPKLKEYKITYGQNIPVTFGLMTSSPVFSNNTYKELVQEMIRDYGCSVAIHGYNSYTSYSESELFNFLDNQKERLTTLCNAEPTSIIYPNHDYNKLSSTIAGSYFGVCCTGGVNNPIYYGGPNIRCAGPRSNMYTLYRFSLLNSAMTNQKIKDAIDYAYDNNMILLPFWHDVSLTQDDVGGLTAEQKQAFLDYCVQYAYQKGLTFINVGDIPNII